jgi:hypothetical protein
MNDVPFHTFNFSNNYFRLTGGIVMLVLITYIPYLAQWQMDILVQRDISLMTTATLVFSWIGRYFDKVQFFAVKYTIH